MSYIIINMIKVFIKLIFDVKTLLLANVKFVSYAYIYAGGNVLSNWVNR